LDTLFDQSNELYLKYINNYISIKRLKKVIHQYPNYIKNDNVILKIFFKKKYSSSILNELRMERNYANLMMILLRCILVILMIYKNKFCHVKNFLYICIKLVSEPDTEINL